MLVPGFAAAVDVNAECNSLYGSSYSPVVGMVDKSIVSLSRPAKGVRQREAAFGSCLYRATDHAKETGTSFVRNDYSRRQAFNADNTYLLTYGYGGKWFLYNANTLQFIRTLAFHGTAEPHWDATNPKVLYFLPSGGGMTLSKLNVDTNVATVVADFRGRLPWSSAVRVWTRGEGSPSANGRYWCFMAENSSSGMLGLVTYDLVTNTILGTRSMSSRPNHVSMSPSGKYCVVSSTTVYSQNLSTSRLLYNGTEHNDLAIGADGRDYYVYTDQAVTGYVTMVDLETGARTSLIPTWIGGTVTSLHISGKAFNKPGWILVSTYKHSGSLKWAHERVIAVQMKANPRIVSLAHHRTYVSGYWVQPHASPSRDFSRVVFNSNWGSTSNMDTDVYMVKLASNMLGGGTTSTTDPIGTTAPTSDTTAPTVNTSLSVYSSSITMNANATDNVGVTRVEFYIDGQKKGQDYSATWGMSMSTASWWPGSTHTYMIKAYDAAGNVRSSNSITFTTGKSATYSSATVPSSTSTGTSSGSDTTAPTVNTQLSVYSSSITMNANAVDNVGVARVEFYIDGQKKGQDYSATWGMSMSTASWWPGSTHVYTIKAYDKAGNVRTSNSITFTTGKSGSYFSATVPSSSSTTTTTTTTGTSSSADTTAPTVNTSLSVYSSSITMNANATDSSGVSKVEFYIDGQKKGQDYAPGWSMSMSTASWWPGSTHVYTIKAYDKAGNVRSSNSITFTTGKSGSFSSATVPSSTSTTSSSSSADTTAPTVSASVAVSSGSITMKASASDNVGVARVDFYIDGVKKGYDTTSAYSLYWNTSSWWPGSSHTLVAKAYDKAGNVRSSSGVTFRIP